VVGSCEHGNDSKEILGPVNLMWLLCMYICLVQGYSSGLTVFII
jgi:hypothetical protein